MLYLMSIYRSEESVVMVLLKTLDMFANFCHELDLSFERMLLLSKWLQVCLVV